MKKGKVIFAGAGPGDPELITVKAVKALRLAEVILTDRLVSKEILELYVSPHAKVIYVGKQCRSGLSVSQSAINDLMVMHALEEKIVVRLKGGDVSIFSNILDELQTLVTYQIPYEIIPGITAASGSAAYAGIPLTARGYSKAVRFLTYYKSDVLGDEYWKELAKTDDTLVFYMSAETIDVVVHNLVTHEIAKDKLLAIIEQATTPFQHVQMFTLYEYERRMKGRQLISPSLLIVGKVVALHPQFNWLSNNSTRESYFKPGPSLSLSSSAVSFENSQSKSYVDY